LLACLERIGFGSCGTWKKENRLRLLEVAEESLKAVGLEYDKAGLQRLIQREKQDDAKDDEE